MLLRITEGKDGNREYKYPISNAWEGECTTEELVRIQSQPYFVERSFKEARPQKGITEQEIMEQIHKRHEQRKIQKNRIDST